MTGDARAWSDWPQELRLERLGDVPSTQDLMRERLSEGRGVHGLVLRARSQLRGKGRQDTTWSSEPGGSYQTVALRDDSGSLQAGGVTLAIALGIAQAFAAAHKRLLVKWPNDLYLPTSRELPSGSSARGGLLPGKLGGILCEQVKGHLLVGVGLNVRNEAPPGAGRLVDLDPRLEPDEVSDLVLRGIEQGLLRVLASDLSAEFGEFDLLAGRRILVQDGRAQLEGVAAGVDSQGCLLIRNENGATSSCRARIVAVD